MLTLLALATSSAHAGWAPTFSDNFNAYDTNPFHGTNSWVTEFPPPPGDGWTTVGTAGVRAVSTTTGGTWGGVGDAMDNILHKGVVTTSDVRIDVRVDYANEVGYGNAMGVVWRYNVGGSYYLVALSRTNGTLGKSFGPGSGPVTEQFFTGIRLFKVSATGTATQLAQHTTSITAGSPQLLRVEMVGGRITVQLDSSRNVAFESGEMYINFLDSTPLPAGEVGLFAFGAGGEQATFDDLIVSENDLDNDLVADIKDNCVSTPNPTQADIDNNGVGNACQDNDNDGSFDDKEIVDGTNRSNPDTDTDGILDGADNCGAMINPDQLDTDGDKRGDACDPDDDGDGFSDPVDNCPLLPNAAQADLDVDGVGDACDSDDDGDGFNDTADNCPINANPSQFDLDSDGLGDACDDIDGDGVFDALDDCPFNADPGQEDGDGDGVGDACDSDIDGDGWDITVDCDETRDDINPGAAEECDGVDQDCDNDIDDGLPGCDDFDRDGVPAGLDCDDLDPNVMPGAPEQCNVRDDDCDGTVDEDVGNVDWYRDQDGDGHGENASAFANACQAPPGTVWRRDDCNDNDVTILPGADETCDNRDNDCDGIVDTDATDGPWYRDVDGDGFGGDVATVCSTKSGALYTNNATRDCNDNNASIAPGHLDLCDGIDEDCDGTDDEDAVTTTYYRDGDGDTWGWSNDALDACSRPAGFVSRFGDCDDAASGINPEETDVPGDGIDQDCDGEDPGDPDLDSDGDGLTDGEEDALGLDPALPDSDGDGVEDLTELGDPDEPTDSDGDGWIDADDADDDGDGVPSSAEGAGDTDGDGVPDRLDTDSDGDSVVDGAEQRDADGDGVLDALQVGGREHPEPEPLEDLGFGCASAPRSGLLGALVGLLFARRRRGR